MFDQPNLSLMHFLFYERRRVATTLLVVVAALSFIYPAMIVRDAFAANPPVVTIGAVLTKVSDGTAPFASVDPNGNNDLVATMDSASYNFDVSFNTLDALPHVVKTVKVVATLSSTASDVRWNLNSLPSACGTKSVTADGKTLTCNVSGTVNTGTALSISASWYGAGSVPNNTDVSASFKVSAEMDNDATVDPPAEAISNTDTLKVVSENSQYEVRKLNGSHLTRVIRDANGVATELEVDWGVQVEVKSPTPGQLKGVSTSNLGSLTLKDLMNDGPASTFPIQDKGTFVGCYDVTSSNDPHLLPNSRNSSVGDYAGVDDSGTWSCAQAGGTGNPISITANGIKWGARWSPGGKSSAKETSWAFANTNSSRPDEVYNSPSGQNNQFAVATQLVRVRYPFSAVLSIDQTAADKDSRVNYIQFCNDIGDIDVDGGANGVDDASNNTACTNASNISSVGPLTQKHFVQYKGDAVNARGPEYELGLSEGAYKVYPDGATDNYVAPGQKFGIDNTAQNDTVSVNPLSNYVSCDVIENSKYNLIAHEASTPQSSSTGSATHPYYNWYKWGGTASGFANITDADVVVEFATTSNSFPTPESMRLFNCDDAGIQWESDPTNVAGGLNAVKLMRIKILKPIPPGEAVAVRTSFKAKSTLPEATPLYNFMQFKTTEISAGTWRRAGPNCKPDTSPWNATSGSYSCQLLVDRAFVILAPPMTQISDTPNSPMNDEAVRVSLGALRDFTIKSGTGYNADVHIENVKVYTVLPPGIDYVSSTVNPTSIITDCDGALNRDCVSDSSKRTDIGYRTLVWDRGDFDFDYTNNDGTIQLNRTMFGQWVLSTKVSNFVPNGVSLQIRTWTDSDEGLTEINYPIAFRNTNTIHNDLQSGFIDDDWLTIATAQAFSIEKYVADTEIPLNGTAKYTLAFGNLTGGSKVMDAIDIFPFNGDARTPPSVIDGGFELDEIIDSQSLLNKVYVTDADPTTLNKDPNHSSNPAVGTGKWKCTYEELGTAGCPEKDEVTAIRLKSNSMSAGVYGLVQIHLKTFGNDGEETYTNNFFARATNLALPVTSSDVTVTTPACMSVGNLVFVDANDNGKFDAGDTGTSGVAVDLMSEGPDGDPFTSDDLKVKSATTDADGRWAIHCVAAGQYYAQIDSDLFDDGEVLDGFDIAKNGEENVSNNKDEDDDHNLLFVDGQYRTEVFEVNDDGPLGEPGTHPGADKLDNLTIDLGLKVAVVPTTTTTTTTAPPDVLGEVVERVTGNLPFTGFTVGFIILLAGGLIMAGRMLHVGSKFKNRKANK